MRKSLSVTAGVEVTAYPPHPIVICEALCLEYSVCPGVEVTASSPDDAAQLVTHKADAVLCTLPLGVLQESVRSGGSMGMQFSPALPTWKTDAINRMGFGNLNKVRDFSISGIECIVLSK